MAVGRVHTVFTLAVSQIYAYSAYIAPSDELARPVSGGVGAQRETRKLWDVFRY